jgi:hypothetical protein
MFATVSTDIPYYEAIHGRMALHHIRMRSSPQAMSSLPAMSCLPVISAYESNERIPLKEEKETHPRSRTIALSKYGNAGDAFHDWTNCALDMRHSTIEVTYEDE